jgi:hypothetical protein
MFIEIHSRDHFLGNMVEKAETLQQTTQKHFVAVTSNFLSTRRIIFYHVAQCVCNWRFDELIGGNRQKMSG